MKKYIFILLLMASSVLGRDVYLNAKVPATADSLKWFLYYETSSIVADSTSGAARTSTRAYDTTITVNDDSAYIAILAIWYPGASGIPTTWEWPIPPHTLSTDSLLAVIDAIRDSLQYLVTATGFSTFDNTTDAVIVNLDNATGTLSDAQVDDITVTAGTVSDKTGYALTQSFPTNFADLAITATTGLVSVGTNNDKTGYSLTQAFPTNFSSLSIDGSGYVTVVTNNDKTGYALSTAGIDAVWEYDTSSVSLGMGAMLKDTSAYQGAASGLTASDVWSYGTRTLTAFGFTIDSADFEDSTFTGALFATNFYNEFSTGNELVDLIWDEDSTGHYTSPNMAYVSAQTAATSLTESSIWTYASRTLTELDEDNTTIDLNASAVGSVSGAVGSVTGNVGGSVASVTGAVGSVTSGVTVTTNNDKTGYALSQSFPTNFADLNISATTGLVRVDLDNSSGTLSDAQVDDITVTAGTVSDKTGYSISGTKNTLDDLNDPTVGAIADAVWDEDSTGHYTSPNMAYVASQTTASSLTAADIWSYVTRTLTTADWLTTGDISGLSTYDPTTDSVLIANRGEIAGQIADSTGVSSFDPTTDSVLIKNRGEIARQIADTTLTDSTSYQGAAASLSVTQIDSTLTANHGSGNWTSGASGSGYTYYIVVVDTGAVVDSVVPQAIVYVNNQAQNATPYEAMTDNNGRATFGLTAGTWVRFTTEPGFAPQLDTFTVSGTGTDTIKVYRDAGTKTTVAFDLSTITDIDLASAHLRIELRSQHDSLLTFGGQVLFNPYVITLTADNEGLASANFPPNDSLTNDSTYYIAYIRDKRWSNDIGKFKFRVPVSDTTVYAQNLTRWDIKF